MPHAYGIFSPSLVGAEPEKQEQLLNNQGYEHQGIQTDAAGRKDA